MTQDEITAEVGRLIRELMTDLKVDILPTSTFEDLGMDSLTQVDLLAAAESAFGVSVPDEDVGSFLKVQDLTDFVLSARVG